MSAELRTVTQAARHRRRASSAYVAAIVAARETHTLTEIAAAAGISHQSVSRLLQRNAPDHFAPKERNA